MNPVGVTRAKLLKSPATKVARFFIACRQTLAFVRQGNKNHMQPQAAKLNPAVGRFLIRQLANFQSGSWPTLHLAVEHIKDECNARENINTRKVFTSLDTGQISGILALLRKRHCTAMAEHERPTHGKRK